MVRESLESVYSKRASDLSACNFEFLKTIEELRGGGHDDVATIWNASFHVNAVDQDISAFLYLYETSKEVWARRAIARSLTTLLYEATEDLPQLYGKAFMTACRRLGVYSEFEANLKAARRPLIDFKESHEENLQDIRIRSGAHKDHDAFQFMEGVAMADPGKLVDLSLHFMDVLLTLGQFSSLVIEKVGSNHRAAKMSGKI